MAPRLVNSARDGAFLALAMALSVSGCTSTMHESPPDMAAANTPFRKAPADRTDALDAATWRGFGDPVLDDLVARTRLANLDVRIALQRVRQARAGTTAAASRLWPTVSATGSVSDQRTGLPEETKRGSPDIRAIRGAVELGWEVDLFGAARAAADGAELDALAAEAGVDAARWFATTEVARQYLVWLGAQVRLQQLQALLQVQQDTERLTRNKQAEGLASSFDVNRAAGETQALAAQLPPLRTFAAVTEHQIDLLLGASPGSAQPPWNTAAPSRMPEVPQLAPGQPIELLHRRPDLRVAHQQWLAEAARLRESEADQWPKFFIAAVLGQQDLRLNILDLSPARYSNCLLYTSRCV